MRAQDFSAALAQTLTDASGRYEFSSLNIDALTISTPYIVAFSLEDAALVALQPTDAFVGADGALDSSGVLSEPASRVVLDTTVATGTWGSNIDSFDYGFVERLTIGDRVWCVFFCCLFVGRGLLLFGRPGGGRLR